ncbi:MAG: ATP-grasp domain-containing protein [Bacteroidota bacterium]
MTQQYNILVTGVGAIIGYGIIESLRLANVNCKIVGLDIFQENYGKYVCDEFIQVPYTSNPEYKNIITKIISDHQIDIVFPGIEQDLYYFIDNQHNFKTRIVLNKKELVHLSKDKWSMYQFLKGRSYSFLIPTFIDLNYKSAAEKIGLPFVIKPKSSYASKGFYVIRNEADYLKIADEVNEATLFQPSVGTVDDEYTISVFGDGTGNYIDSLILRRYLSKAGASEKTYTIKNDELLMKAIKDLVKIFKPEGPTNFQFRKQNNKVYLLEINPRISSACSLRTKFGYNDPLFCIQHYLENKTYSIQDKKEGRAIRYIADQITYE